LAKSKTNQSYFSKIFFHLSEVTVYVEFAHEKNLFLTSFTHLKSFWWKDGGLSFQILPGILITHCIYKLKRKVLANSAAAVILLGRILVSIK